jgi:murein DD-endopeptidase MepM/ murein hydrolase activator NlpD
MRPIVPGALALLLAAAATAQAQDAASAVVSEPQDDTREIGSVVHPRAIAAAQALGLAPAPGAHSASVGRASIGRVNFPLRLMPNSSAVLANSIGQFVDLDPSSGVQDFACGSRTYDGHTGTDFSLGVFRWARMDAEEVEIVAAAPGTIVLKQDGNFDRQCLPLAQLPANAAANFVVILQDDGVYAYYYHMKSGTVTGLPVGTHVAAGTHLGFVGSSGRSVAPHLHFELNTANAGTTGRAAVDPFAGQCGAATTLWANQWEAQADPRLMSLTTHSAPPVVPSDNCDTTGQVLNYADNFSPGNTAYGVVTLRDQRPGDVATLQFVKPDGTIFSQGPTGSPSSLATSTYWTRSVVLPAAPTGVWKLRALMNTSDRGNFQLEKAFFVGTAPGATQILSAVLPSGRSIQDAGTATLFAAIINAGNSTAYGCSIAAETPLAADFLFQTVNSQNILTGSPNISADIPPGAVQNFVVAFTPRLNFEAVTQTAAAADVTLNFHCTNAPAAVQIKGVNNLILSFSPGPVPDVIAIGDTVSHDGIFRVPNGGTAAFVVATSNVGSAAPVTVTPVASAAIPLALSICETDPSSGACIAAPAASVSRVFAAGETATWGVFGRASGGIAFDPAGNRISVQYVDGVGILRGATSVAVTTQ